MRTELHTEWTVGDLCRGFTFDRNEGRGLFGLDGRLVIQPEYQRNYIYGDGRRDVAVVESLLKGYPLGLIYFVRNADGLYEVLDGQQRITSFARYVTMSWPFAVELDGRPRYFDSLDGNLRDRILNTGLTVYVCEGDPSEIQSWFETINMQGVPLVRQELRNAAYHGPFVTLARRTFSNTDDSNMNRWRTYIAGDPKRQAILETALDWASDGHVDDYMARHRYDTDISELRNRFDAIINWVDATFEYAGREMCGRDWGRLYREYHTHPYRRDDVTAQVSALLADPQVSDKKGIFEYVLGGGRDKSLLHVRVFDEKTIATVYQRQTAKAREEHASNCPMCADTDGPNRNRIYSRKEMDADHVTAWSRGGDTTIDNCQLLCRTHNRAKGNK